MTPKSCLKAYQSPPRTPDLSSSPSPSVSGRTSPSGSACSAYGGCCEGRLAKTVSFCAEEALEEVFVADDWDRSPAPVTPKLSYQDVLELKQLQLSLPRAPTPSTYRQPFTTSSPSAYTHTHSESCASSSASNMSNGGGAFPLSRFAAQPSQTPSRWKNRRQNSSDIDPEILPYLEAVPIRLLPLLDSSSSAEAENSSARPAPSVPSTSASGGLNSNPGSASSPPSLPSAPRPSPHSSLASMDTPSSSSPSSQHAVPAQPFITLHSPSGTASVPALPSPPPTPTLSPTSAPAPAPARRTHFAFVPLLPVQDAPAPAPALPVEKKEEERPRRRINMTFVPLMGAEPPSRGPSPSPSSNSDPIANVNAGRSVSPQEQRTPTLGPVEPPDAIEPEEEEADAGEGSDADQDQERERGTSTPSLSSASDTDTDVETDREHDNDNDIDNGTAARVHAEYRQYQYQCEEAVDAGETRATFDAYGYTYADTTYFSPRGVSSTAGLTPPLGALFPGLGRGLAAEMPKRRLLAALPSPALVPPSPFSLYPPGVSPGAGWGGVVGGASPFVPLAELASVAEGAEGEGAGEVQVVSATTRTMRVVVAGSELEQGLGAGEGVTLMASSSSLVVEARSTPFVPIEEPSCQGGEAAAAAPAGCLAADSRAGLGIVSGKEQESGVGEGEVDGVVEDLANVSVGGEGAVGLERSVEAEVLRPSIARRERVRGPACEPLVEA